MIIRMMSDLHLEFGKFKIPPLPDDINSTLVLAGDVGLGKSHRNWIEDVCRKFKYVVYVFGNHEFYHNNMPGVRMSWRDIEADIENLFLLDTEHVDLDGVRFVGGTLWTDCKNNNPMIMNYISGRMNDFQIISTTTPEGHPFAIGPYITFTPAMAFTEHVKTFKYIDRLLNKPFDGKIVVVTHHAPSYKSVAEQFRGINDYEMNFAYFTDLDWMMEKYDITYWVHGHMHNSSDYKVGNARVICNPRGYVPNDLNPEFDPVFLVDTEANE